MRQQTEACKVLLGRACLLYACHCHKSVPSPACGSQDEDGVEESHPSDPWICKLIKCSLFTTEIFLAVCYAIASSLLQWCLQKLGLSGLPSSPGVREEK